MNDKPKTLSDKQWTALWLWPGALLRLPGDFLRFWRNEKD